MVYLKPKQLIIKDCPRRFVLKLYRDEASRFLFATAELLVSPVKWLAGKIVCEMTYNMLSGTLNGTVSCIRYSMFQLCIAAWWTRKAESVGVSWQNVRSSSRWRDCRLWTGAVGQPRDWSLSQWVTSYLTSVFLSVGLPIELVKSPSFRSVLSTPLT